MPSVFKLANTWVASTSTDTINVVIFFMLFCCVIYISIYSPHIKTQYLQLNQSTEAKAKNNKNLPYKTGKMLFVKANATFNSDAPVMSQFVKRFSVHFK